MDKSRVKALVEDNIERYMRLFGIPHWRVTVEYGPIDSSGACGAPAAEMNVQPQYERALMSIDPEKIQDEEMLEAVLKHELLHILHSPFALVWDAIAEAIPDENLYKAIRSIYWNANEMTVRNLERMHAGHTLTTEEPTNA